ncbi:DUF2249 domain-containing protein [Fodinisporobacter ferrooxydans]|uniref:DUF2249 domain-containing protein n=1 Tax=Fodinisporobacter ferrooxydans TaxID=2901836 RepID=A0ABY4CNI9_9BACL|nr:DUF2249 domain-containing protein [Alicyclobacillaceae bacterium MYW30-H2]
MDQRIVDLDVRDILKAKLEPFQKIMETVGSLQETDILQLHTTFRPTPLLKVLGKKGYNHVVLQMDKEHFIIQFYKESFDMPVFRLNNLGLEPPQPMIRTLEMLDNQKEFQEGEARLEIWNERVPAFLLPELDERGFSYKIVEESEGEVHVQIFR